jgi:hypothetical protein
VQSLRTGCESLSGPVSAIEHVGSQDRGVSRSVSTGSKIGQFGLDEAKSLYLLSSWFGVRVPAGAQDLAVPAMLLRGHFLENPSGIKGCEDFHA